VVSFFFFFLPRLISAVADWMSTILHTWCVLSVNLECRSEMYCMQLSENTGCKKSPSQHHCTSLSCCVFATKARIDNRKKNLLSSNSSSTCSHNMVNLGPLTAEIGSAVLGTHANFKGFRDLAALLHGTLVLGINQTLWR